MIARRSIPLIFGMLLAACAVPLTASAQAPSYSVRGETITGTIASVENVNHIFVADDRGYTDDVTLRSGASIVSNGVRLEPGQRVTITGSNAGRTFLASRIATNGRSDYSSSVATAPSTYPVPVPVYYPAYYAQPVYYGYYAYSPFFYSYYRPYFRGYGPYYRGYGYGYGYGLRGGYGVSVGVHIHIR